MNNVFKLLALVIVLSLLAFFVLSESTSNDHVNTSLEQPLVTDSKGDENKASDWAPHPVSKPVKTTAHPIQQVEAVSDTSLWREKLCQRDLQDCVLYEHLNMSEILPTEHGALRIEPAGIIMQSKGFHAALKKLQGEKEHFDAYQYEDELATYLAENMGHYPSSIIEVACSQSVCLAEINVDAESDLQEMSEFINSNEWPHGSSIIAPVYSEGRLKLRVTTMTKYHMDGGVVY